MPITSCPICGRELDNIRAHVTTGPLRCRLIWSGKHGYECCCGKSHMTSGDVERHLREVDIGEHYAELRLAGRIRGHSELSAWIGPSPILPLDVEMNERRSQFLFGSRRRADDR